MSYANFIPALWNEGINRDLQRHCVFVEDCNRTYEGSVKKLGESVTILGVGKPTIHKIAKNARGRLNDAEVVEDTSVIMYINQMDYFRYTVDDIDKRQAVEGLKGALEAETSEALACSVDTYVASFAVDESVTRLYGDAPVKVVADRNDATGVYVLDILDLAIQRLYENDVNDNAKIVVTVSPRFYTLFKRAYTVLDTDNSGELKNGKVGMYGNVIVKRSNSVHKTDNGTVDNMMIRTQRAIAFAQPETFTEAQRAKDSFADEVRGYILYDAKVVRPKEIININVKYA
ncbi:MAG: hypothetical protein IJW16_02185 [Clostridia bacterium]|nr:hypothetical protein [Clostridia bacterium]